MKKKVSWFFLLHSFSLPLSKVCSLFICSTYLVCFQSLFLYKKQTAPTSTPNSWCASPMSMGAMSTMGRREVFCDLYSITVLPHDPVCLCAEESETQWLLNNLWPTVKLQLIRLSGWWEITRERVCECVSVCMHTGVCAWGFSSYRAAVLQHAVGEAAVALSSDLHVVGALQQHSLLQVACGGVHVGHAVLAVVGEVLRGLSGKQPQERHLDGGGVWCQAVIIVVELLTGEEKKTVNIRLQRTNIWPKMLRVSLTWNPPFIVSPNQTCLRSLLLLVHQFLRGMLEGLGRTQVSPVSMLQKTLMASMVQPWLGSIQYSPVGGEELSWYICSFRH